MKGVRNIDIKQRDGESKYEQHKRLVLGKTEGEELSDIDYSELSKEAYGVEYGSDMVRRMMAGSRITLHIVEEMLESGINDSEIVDGIRKMREDCTKERMRMFDQRRALNKDLRKRAREEEINDLIVSEMEKIRQLVPLDFTGCGSSGNGDATILAGFCDAHFGIQFRNAWNEYSEEVFCERVHKYVDEIVKAGKLHGASEVVVWNNGDSISGNIHKTIDVQNREGAVHQTMRVAEYIAEMLTELNKHFRSVRYVSVSGNHSRIEQKDNARYNDRLDDIIEWYLNARLADNKHIHIGDCDRIDPTMYTMYVRGKKYLGLHGDYDLSDAKIKSAVEMAGNYSGSDGVSPYAVLIAHKHECESRYVSGTRCIRSGSFMGMDDLCVTSRIIGNSSQMICVCSDNGIDCCYDVDLN